MQLAVYWITAFLDNIFLLLHCKIAKSHVILVIPILNLTPCSSEINPAKQTLDHEKPVECLSQYFGVTLYACISHYFMMQTFCYTKGVPFLSKKSLKRVGCWTFFGASLQKLCWTPPWNTLPHKYGTASQLRQYLATALGQSAKIKRKSIDLPHPFPPPHPCYILTILQNCQHDNSPKLSLMTRMSGQLVLMEQIRKGVYLGNSKLNVV